MLRKKRIWNHIKHVVKAREGRKRAEGEKVLGH